MNLNFWPKMYYSGGGGSGGGGGGGDAGGGGASGGGGGNFAGGGGTSSNEYPSLETPPAGSIRFNTDTGRLEIYNGEKWWDINSTSPREETGDRGLFGGGCASPGGTNDLQVNTIDFVTISTTANAIDFGDLTLRRDFTSACASRTRAFWAGGVDPGTGGLSELDSVTIATRGNAVDFGENIPHRGAGGLSDRTRGVFPSVNGGTNVIRYITMATTGTVQDFGDAYVAAASGGSFASPTRGVSGGGDSPAYTNVIQYITITTQGISADFGDLSTLRGYPVGASSATRGLFMGGFNPSPLNANMNTIEYVQIASLGNASDFGDLVVASRHAGGTSNCIRAIAGAGFPGFAGSIDQVNIATTGNAIDYADMSQVRRGYSGCSNAHGGLG